MGCIQASSVHPLFLFGGLQDPVKASPRSLLGHSTSGLLASSDFILLLLVFIHVSLLMYFFKIVLVTKMLLNVLSFYIESELND